MKKADTDSISIKQDAAEAEERRAKIAEAAYFRAERRGFVGGDPVEDWLEAEKETLGDGLRDTDRA